MSNLLLNRLKALKISNFTNLRLISTTSALNVKEIKEVQNGDELVIYGEIKESNRVPFLVKNPHKESNVCAICASGLEIKHTDVMILSQFLRSDGCMLPRRVTGLCNKQQRRVSTLVAMAQKSGLMPNLTPSKVKKEPNKRPGWKKYNKYFLEETIKLK